MDLQNPTWISRTFQEKCSQYRQKQHRNMAKKAPLSSYIEGYIFAIQEEEINTNLLVAKRDGDRNTNCRLCKKEKKSI